MFNNIFGFEATEKFVVCLFLLLVLNGELEFELGRPIGFSGYLSQTGY